MRVEKLAKYVPKSSTVGSRNERTPKRRTCNRFRIFERLKTGTLVFYDAARRNAADRTTFRADKNLHRHTHYSARGARGETNKGKKDDPARAHSGLSAREHNGSAELPSLRGKRGCLLLSNHLNANRSGELPYSSNKLTGNGDDFVFPRRELPPGTKGGEEDRRSCEDCVAGPAE